MSTTTKVSQLPAAVIPLAGDEEVMIVQSGTSRRCAASDIAGAITGELPIEKGGTGQATANDALNALLPDQTGQDGFVLTTDGANTQWAPAGGGGGGSSVQYFQLFAEQTSNDASGSLQLIDTAADINDGDTVLVQYYGIASDAAGTTPELELNFSVNGSGGGLFYAPLNLEADFTFTLLITRVGASLSVCGWCQIGLNQLDSSDPSVLPHQGAIQDGAAYAGTLTVSVPFVWTGSTTPSITIAGGFAQIMRAPPIINPA